MRYLPCPALLAFLLPTNAYDDRLRLGTYLTSSTIYRTAGNTNVVQVGIAKQEYNLTISTSVDYIMVVGTECQKCTVEANKYDTTSSPSWASSGLAFDYAFTNPYAHPGPRTAQSASEPDSAQLPTLVNIDAVIGSEVLLDARKDDQARTIVVIEKMTDGDGGNALARMQQGSSGFWGLGIDPTAPMNSIMTSVKAAQSASNFTVGFDMRAWSSDMKSEAGQLHWGAAPVSAYEGSFNWVKSLGISPSWAFRIGKFSVRGHDISGKNLTTLVDPGYNAIVVPTAVAQQVYSRVKGSKQHPQFSNRWIIPCDSVLSFSVRINDHTYSIPDEGMVQAKGQGDCWGSVISWDEGHAPDQAGRIILGTPFLAYYYSVLYLADQENLIGIAGKPGIIVKPKRYTKKKLSKSATGGIIAAVCITVFFSLSVCYCRQRDSPAGWYNRMNRKQRRAAAAQMAIVSPLAPPPVMPMLAPPVFGPPRHAEIYTKPFVRGSANQEREDAMMLDPVSQAYLPQLGSPLRDYAPEHDSGNIGFFSRIQGFFRRGNQNRQHENAESESHADYGHNHHRQRHQDHRGHRHHHSSHHQTFHQESSSPSQYPTSEAGHTYDSSQRHGNRRHGNPRPQNLHHSMSLLEEPYLHHMQMNSYNYPAHLPSQGLPGVTMQSGGAFLPQGQAYPYMRGAMQYNGPY